MIMKKKQTRAWWMLAMILIIAALVFAFRPGPVSVQVATVSTGPLQQTVEEEGKTRMHDRFTLASSVAGKLRRVELHHGDFVRAGEVITWMDPTPLEPRQTAVLHARLEAARAAEDQANADVGRAQAENAQAALDLERTRKLFEQGVASREAYDKASSSATSAVKQLDSAKSRAESAAYQVKEARSALMDQSSPDTSLPVPIKTPVAGRVLRLLEQSERVVPAGTAIIEIGYMPKLEIVADFLTRDAVKISSGMEAIIDDWGGDKPLRARVRVVEPGAFTKVSALGVEEQRVNVVLDFVDTSDKLADAYRVEVRVVIWQAPAVLKVPSGALFRAGEQWQVFKMENGRAQSATIQTGHRGAFEAEVLSGLKAGDAVIVHPSAEVTDGVRVSVPRQSASILLTR
jgi:HlyD family secretion protein